MNLIICLDDNKGILFNKRRQSRDSVVVERIIQLSKGSKLWMSNYSKKLFPDNGEIIVDDDFLAKSELGDFCFAEKGIDTLEQAESVYVFLWNRSYPSDVKFGFDLEQEGFVLENTEDFPGSSHENITLNIYKRVNV